jgi:hypothetical protein
MELVIVVGEGKQLRAQRIQGDTRRVIYTRWRRSKRKCRVFCGLQNLNPWLKCNVSTVVCFNEEPPHENSIPRCDRQLKETGSLLDKHRSGRPSVSDESVENTRNSFIRSPKKSVHACARELGLSLVINFSCCVQSAQVIIATDTILLWIFLMILTSGFYIV